MSQKAMNAERLLLEYERLAAAGEMAPYNRQADLVGFTERPFRSARDYLIKIGAIEIEKSDEGDRVVIVRTGAATAWRRRRVYNQSYNRVSRKKKRPEKPYVEPKAPAPLHMSILPIRGANWTPRTCQYVTGPIVRHVGAEKCGKPVTPGSSWCQEHYKRCHIAGSAAKKEIEGLWG